MSVTIHPDHEGCFVGVDESGQPVVGGMIKASRQPGYVTLLFEWPPGSPPPAVIRVPIDWIAALQRVSG